MNIRFDWISVTFKDFDYRNVVDVISLLGVEPFLFTDMKCGRYSYRAGATFENISIYYDGAPEMGVMLDISGKGVTYLYNHDLDFKDFFMTVQSLNTNITRVDVALDLFDHELDYDVLFDAIQKHNYKSRWRKVYDNSSYTMKGKALGIQFGSRSSDFMLRIYDKKMESDTDEYDYWCRMEEQLRHESAEALIGAWLQDPTSMELVSCFLFLLSRNLDFVDRSKYGDKNIDKCPKLIWWVTFLDIFAKSEFYDMFPKKVPYTEEKFITGFRSRCGQQCNAFIKMYGVDALLHLISNVQIKNYDYRSLMKLIKHEGSSYFDLS